MRLSMNPHKESDMNARPLSWVWIFFFAIVGGACSTPPVERQERTAQTLGNLTEDMKATRFHIEKTLASLNGLVSAPPDHLREAYNQFDKDVKTVGKDAKAVERRSQETRDR